MSSLADQLIKAGLAKEKPQTQAKRHTKKKPKKTQSPQKPANTQSVELLGKPVTPSKKERQSEIENRRLLNIKILNLFNENGAEQPSGEATYNYTYQDKIKRIYVSEKQRKQLIAGELAITVFRAKTQLIPASIVGELAQLDPKRFIHIADTESQEDKNDPHAVPDDLMW